MSFLSKKNKSHRHILLFCLFVAVGWIYLVLRLGALQISHHDKYQAIVADQLTRETSTSANRGKIYDNNMNLLATNTTVYRVFIAPRAIRDFENESEDYEVGEVARIIADKLAEVLGVDPNMVMEKSQKVNRWDETIKKNVDPETAKILREFVTEKKFSRLLNLEAGTKRYYCFGDLACHLLGFTNADGDGVYGVEATYNSYLKGVSGKYIIAMDAAGNDMPFKYESFVGAENGANIVTTIDMRLQYALENQLIAANESAKATNRVCGIVMDVNTGGILAAAVVPGYDCNNPYTLDEEHEAKLAASGLSEDSEEYAALRSQYVFEMWNNKIVNEPYEPGSTFKIITSAIAIEEGVVSPDDPFYCRGYHFVEGYGKPISCHRLSGHGAVTFARGLQQSCNPLMMTTVEKIGLETFYKYFEALGYTAKTGVDLTGEAYGSYHEMKNMHSVELAVYSFGQTFKATPLQQLTAICAVANGGYLVTPHVMDRMIDDDGNILQTYDSGKKVQIFSAETCETITSILAEGVATDGGAKNAYTKGYSVAAKTGTSQKQDKYVYYDAEGNVVSATDEWVTSDRPYRIGSTVAYAPADDPQIAVIIIVDEPSPDAGGQFGSIVAAPYVSNFLSAALPYLGYDPQYTEEELAKQDVGIADLTGLSVSDATLYITNRKLSFKTIGKGNVVMSQTPAGGSRLSLDNGVVYLYVGEEEPANTVEVPSVMGETAAACNKTLINAKLNIKIEGATNYNVGAGAQVISQTPEAGTMVPPGTIVTVEFRYMDGTD